MKKNIIILESAPGARLTNQLWNFISVYAYCLEKEFTCKNYCFFEQKRQPDGSYSRLDYNNFFNFPHRGFFNRLLVSYQVNQNKLCQKFRPYDRYANFIKRHRHNYIINSGVALKENGIFYLPPSFVKNDLDKSAIEKIEQSKNKNIYLIGWLFRNPIGIKKYHKEIKNLFLPKKEVLKKINDYISPIRKSFKKIVGVHIRQGDYRNFNNGLFFYSPDEVKKILNDFLNNFKEERDKTHFIICSDEKINQQIFTGLNCSFSNGSAIHDLFLLAETDLVMGSNSTFGALAAYFGNIPFIVFEKNINWNFYKDKRGYFENKKCTVACF